MTTTDEEGRLGDALLARVHEMSGRRILRPLEPDDGEDLAPGGDLDAHRLRRWHAAIPRRFHRATLDQFTGDVGDELASWSTNPDGRNLVMFGPVGVGKSHAAVAAVHRAHETGLDVRFLPVGELLDLLRPGGPEHALYDLADVDRLIVDDLGSERSTDWTGQQLYDLVNRRWLEQRPTIVTTNVEPDALEESDPRMFSRLVGNAAVVLRLSGPDRRRI